MYSSKCLLFHRRVPKVDISLQIYTSSHPISSPVRLHEIGSSRFRQSKTKGRVSSMNMTINKWHLSAHLPNSTTRERQQQHLNRRILPKSVNDSFSFLLGYLAIEAEMLDTCFLEALFNHIKRRPPRREDNATQRVTSASLLPVLSSRIL